MLNSTTVGWMPEPQVRGTIGLVWSCLATVFICTGSALHFNLPGQRQTAPNRAKEQLVFVVAGLLAPEGLTWLAIAELVQAWQVKCRVSTCVSEFCFPIC
jgi:hypothetical protein